MARVAVVSGGTRGIGAAISKALKAAGYQVAATYAGNDEAAAKFKAETGIPVYKWDVSNYKECAEGLKKVAKTSDRSTSSINNAGITRDTAFHKMTPEQWYEVINTNLNSLFNMTRPVIEGMRERGFGRDRQYFVDQRPEGPVRPDQLFRRRKRATSASPRRSRRKTPARASPSTPSAPAISRPKWSRRCRRMCWKRSVLPLIPVRRLGEPEEIARCVVFLVVRRVGLHHRFDPDHQWRAIYGLSLRKRATA